MKELKAKLGNDKKVVRALEELTQRGKLVCLDEQGNLLHFDVIYPCPPRNERVTSMRKVAHLVEAYKIDAIAVGNGTASRETEEFLKRLSYPRDVKIIVVSEAGASVYSAS
ncbi:MAG: RNA-binding transcriptional accessory protein, partial [Butyricicoccus sp.]|nr:RNA-binding transcriptional accessory protein [Butyricicoccus sp.]